MRATLKSFGRSDMTNLTPHVNSGLTGWTFSGRTKKMDGPKHDIARAVRHTVQAERNRH